MFTFECFTTDSTNRLASRLLLLVAMYMLKCFPLFGGCVLALVLAAVPGFAQPTITNINIGTAFRYQGALRGVFPNTSFPQDGAQHGVLPFQFTLWNDPANTNPAARIGSNILQTLSVSNGFFSTLIDFGDVFDGRRAFLEVSVFAPSNTMPASSNWITVGPRSEIGAVPHSLWARRGGTRVLSTHGDLLGFIEEVDDQGFFDSYAYLDTASGHFTNFGDFRVVGQRMEIEEARILVGNKSVSYGLPLPGVWCPNCSTILTLELWRMTNAVVLNGGSYQQNLVGQFVRTLSPPVNVGVTNHPSGLWISLPITNAIRFIEQGEVLRLRSRSSTLLGVSGARALVEVKGEVTVREIP